MGNVERDPKLSGEMWPVNHNPSLENENYYVPQPNIHFTDSYEEASKFLHEGMQIFEIPETGKFAICPQEYKVNKTPARHTDDAGNVISDALYYIDEFMEEGYAVYLSYLPPGKQTSSAHSHYEGMYEHYKVISGDAEITFGFGEQRRKVGFDEYLRVPFGMGHQMTAGERGVLTLICTENPDNRPSGSLHIREDALIAA